MKKKARSKIPLKPKAPFRWVFMDIIPSTAPKRLTIDTHFSNYLLIVDAYSKIPKLYGMEKITTEEVMEKLDMFQSRFGKIDQFGWLDLERISADAGTEFTLTDFKYECQTRGVCLTLSAPKHQEMNGQVEVTRRTFRTVPSTAPKSLTSDTTFSNYLLIFDTYSNIPKLYSMDNITTE